MNVAILVRDIRVIGFYWDGLGMIYSIKLLSFYMFICKFR